MSTLLFLKILFIYFQSKKKGRREGEKHQCVVASCVPPTGDLTCNPGMSPDWESNRHPYGSQAGVQSTEPHQPELLLKNDIGQRKKRWDSSQRKKNTQKFGHLRHLYIEKKTVVRKTKDASENGDNWDKILEETREERIPGTNREVTSRKIKKSMSFIVIRWKEQKPKQDF